jgi:hypothetical protein
VDTDPLGVYLNDHLAGSAAALEMMEEVAAQARGEPLGQKLAALRAQVGQEQERLRELLARIDTSENRLKQAAAWVTERVGRGKLALSARVDPALATLQGLEALVLGLQGKLGLYRTLAELEPNDPRLSGIAYAALAARTLEQQAMVEHERLAASRVAFRPRRSDESAPSG